jgi:protein required for attachment to host cells
MTFKHEARRPSTTWILVADRARARLFSAEWPELGEFQEIRGFAHPEGAARAHDVEADGPGRLYGASGPRHAADRRTDFKHQTATEFARELVGELQAGKDANTYGRLVVIAPALFLGVLREQLPSPLRSLVVADLDKDLTQTDVDTIKSEASGLVAATTET